MTRTDAHRLFLLALMVMLLTSGSIAAAQEKSVGRKPIIERAEYCESLKAYLDYVAVSAGQDKRIFIITRLGQGESSRRLNRRRLANLYRYFNYQREIAAERIVRAQGERGEGLGRAEIYVDGELILIVTVKRGKEILGRKECSAG